MSPHPLTNFEIQKYQNEPKFNGIYSRNNLSKTKDGAYIIILDECESIGDLLDCFVNAKNIIYFDSFGVVHIPKELKHSLEIKLVFL